MINIQTARYFFQKAFLPGITLVVFLISFGAAFYKLSLRWNVEDDSYCYFVPLVVLYLAWDKRARNSKLKGEKGETGIEDKGIGAIGEGGELGENGFKFGEFSWSTWGLIPVVLSLVFIFAGEVGSVETLMYLGLWGGIIGIFCCFYGARVRQLVFPLFILLFIIPLPPFLSRELTFQLKLMASVLAVVMLQFSGVSVFRDGNIIDIGVAQLQVVDACSGLRYVMPLLLLALLMGYFFSRGWWRKCVLLLLVVPLSVKLNAFRIWLTGMLTVNGHAELAQDLFHDLSGWLIFMIASAILYGAHLILKRLGSDSEEKRHIDPGAKPVGLLKPAVLTVVICFVFAGSGLALKKIPSADNLPSRESFESFPLTIGQWEGRREYLSKDIMDELWADDYVSETFGNKQSPNFIYLFIPFYEYQSTRHTAHAPQACLLGGGWATLASADRPVIVGDAQNIIIKTMLMQKGDSRILSSYFFFQRGRVIISPWMNKLYLMLDAFTKRRTDGALVRVEMALAPGQTEEQAFPILEGFIAELWKILPDYVPL